MINYKIASKIDTPIYRVMSRTNLPSLSATLRRRRKKVRLCQANKLARHQYFKDAVNSL